MQYITVREAAQKWGVTTRRVQMLCDEKRIKGAYRFGKSWMIPATAVLPNARLKDAEPTLPMPRKSPFLDMTNLYNKAGGADECAEMLVNQPEAYALFQAQIAFRRGEIEKVYEQARYSLSAHSGFYAILGGGMLLAQCAIWRGDIFLWNEAIVELEDYEFVGWTTEWTSRIRHSGNFDNFVTEIPPLKSGTTLRYFPVMSIENIM